MSKAATDEEINYNDIFEIYKSVSKVKDFKVPTKIKMKQDYYDKLTIEMQRNTNLIEIRDTNMQPLNTLYGLKVEIDNGVTKDWEVVYE